MNLKLLILGILVLFSVSCSFPILKSNQVRIGLEQVCNEKAYLLEGKNIALITNHTGVDRSNTQNIHCLSKIKNLKIETIFSPEHGFKGNFEAGALIHNDPHTKIPIVSLYGKQKSPSLQELKGLDFLVYDIQDVGARFYTYISTLGLAMNMAAKANIPFMVLDRPNPLGASVQGPILDKAYQSFVGAYPIETRYGLTVGQLAKKIIENKWIQNIPKLFVIDLKNWNPDDYYDDTGLAWIAPSPNIPTLETALIYPGTCLLEASNISEGRGTLKPFLQFGAPWLDHQALLKHLRNKNIKGVEFKAVIFTPKSLPGKAENPKYLNTECKGIEILIQNRDQINSPLLGREIIKSIQKLHPNELILNKEFLAKLWGNTFD